jgi:hypothetical protein
VGSLVALELALGTGRAVDPDLRRLIGREVGPPARSVVSTSNLIALNADERNFNNRIRHESQTKTMRGPRMTRFCQASQRGEPSGLTVTRWASASDSSSLRAVLRKFHRASACLGFANDTRPVRLSRRHVSR